ncbi:regulator of chromosome condensation 1/beta-lactamase-inhibitor protein II [Pseudomassariella vexata]|uniref:Regulator of chromosome condensation 1/beta-lactamase-inhibitor protein II n=1 Tax=Pseudomassariella vexata TaxID=1141098 RepID=A0A1Y2E710_9PEZI|nr:regulator of chromosome condensation 1/beta-lactamase-inhibitor protein II [Pseudomassariella vexata]ORY67227.1 regulator of chromosome condensation 1/beta-lactamase-inhibitor protein II [Pseudomassariella vexata]
MPLYRAALRRAPLTCRSLASKSLLTRQSIRYASSQGPGPRGGAGRFVGGFAAALVAATAVFIIYPFYVTEPAKPAQATISYEKPRPVPESKEDNRDLISSQHRQVKKSWEKPGLYAWGSNGGRVAAPNSTENVIKTPRRIPFFDGQLLRDVKLDREFGAALMENGDLVQWGTGFSLVDPKPTTTLKGKDLIKLAVSCDRVLALGKNGTVYSIPASSTDQAASTRTESSSWFGLWSSPSTASYRKLGIPSLSWGERVMDITSGLEHALIVTNRGRVFAAASSASAFPSRGQLGVPGLTWETRPKGPFDQPHEILALKGFNIVKVAAGDYHSLALDKDGRVFVFGDNTSGQLGFEKENEIPYIDAPIPLPFNKIYSGTKQKPTVTSIAAGGANSFFTVDATRIAGQIGSNQAQDVAPTRDIGRVTADVWACGAGIYGSLGNGKWTHVTLGPTKIKPLSGLYEWDEKSNSVIPIRLARLSVGATHASAVMDNVTYVNASAKSSDNDTNWGADIVWWGGNEFYQLGTGKRNNVNVPMYISPLDGGQVEVEKGRKGEQHRFQITPRTTVRLGEGGKGRKVSVEQRVECGRFVTAVYSGT